MQFLGAICEVKKKECSMWRLHLSICDIASAAVSYFHKIWCSSLLQNVEQVWVFFNQLSASHALVKGINLFSDFVTDLGEIWCRGFPHNVELVLWKSLQQMNFYLISTFLVQLGEIWCNVSEENVTERVWVL